jgi:trehalose synthase
MLQKVSLEPKKLKSYKNLIDKNLFDKIINLSKLLKNIRVLHINSTSFGGGVAEILRSLIPLMQDIGIKAEWQTIVADNRLFEITKSFHNGLQGQEINLDREIERAYKRFNAYNAHLIEGNWDVIIIHDPQPAAIPYYLTNIKSKFIWRCHIDTTSPNKKLFKFFESFLSEYKAAVFTMKEFVKKDFPIKKIFIVPPTIDPLDNKNNFLEDKVVEKIIESCGINIKKPIIAQVSRFDKWKDPIGVIKSYKLAKKKIMNLQLVLSGVLAEDDPEGWKIYKEAENYASKDKDIFVFTNLNNFGNLGINALQTISKIILQKSTREGFGLTVAEAMWKGTPVIGGDVGGIRLQIVDGKTGFLIHNEKECAEKIVFLLKNENIRRKLGMNSKKYIQKGFLLPRLLKDHLKIYSTVL